MKFLLSLNGRTRRIGFLIFVLAYIGTTYTAIFADGAFGFTNSEADTGPIELFVSFLLFWPSVAVSVRRFHDIGMSGWWVLWFGLISAAVAVLLLVLAAVGVFGEDVLEELGSLASLGEDGAPLPTFFWILMVGIGVPILIQYGLLFFAPGQNDENEYGPNPRDKARTPISAAA